MSRARAVLLGALLTVQTWNVAVAAPQVWLEVKAEAIPLVGPRLTRPLHARTFQVDLAAVRGVLNKAPMERTAGAQPVLKLPLPRAGTISFRIAESPVMQPELGAKFRETRTYAGTAVSDPRITGRFQIGARGFRAIMFTPQGTVYIDPFTRGDTRHYQVYYAHDLPPKKRPPDSIWQPRRDDGSSSAPAPATSAMRTAARGVSIAGELRTYRLAMGATYQYSSFHDPQDPPNFPRKSVVNDEIVNVVNRVTGVYERELGIRLVLVANNEDAIYNTPAQPYSNGPDMVEVNTIILDQNIGNENYDIGHVASTGGGGIAGLGVVCNNARKGDGVTGLPEPVGDAYYIDFVAHEMGHQFGANHTFNGSETTNCSPNRNSSTAYEPGSGVTIMGYAGVCSEQDIAPHSIDVFHGASFDEIIAYSREGTGNTCPVKTAVANGAPTAEAGPGGFTIPKATPFELTGAACDPDDDPVTYMWEQYDLGPEGHPDEAANAAANQTPPLFRDFLPTESPTRVFPQLDDLLNNRHTMGEILPNNTRAMNFRLIARDYKPGGGGVGSDDLKFSVTAAAGPFVVTFPTDHEDFGGNQAIEVTWDVAGTDAAPVSCPAVDVLLSTDGGRTFPTVLAAATPNDGAAGVTLPQVITNAARIKVKCASSVFFDLSNQNFGINQQVPVLSIGPDYEDPDMNGRFTLTWTRPQGATGPDTMQVAPGSCGPAFLDDASNGMGNWTLTQSGLGANAWGTGTSKPGAEGATFSASAPDGVTNAESIMEMKNPFAVPADGTTLLAFDDWMATEGDDSNSVEIHDGTQWVTVYEVTRAMGAEEAAPAFATEDMTPHTIDLAPFAGKSIRIRFRYKLGPENRAGSTSLFGWHVDNVKLIGKTFTNLDPVAATSLTLRDQAVGAYCYQVRTRYTAGDVVADSLPSNMVTVEVAQGNVAPVAAAVAPADVDEGTLVTLASTGTEDANNDPLTYEWTQVSGPAVAITDGDKATATFTAPAACDPVTMVFELTVTDDSGLTDTAQVTVTSNNINQVPTVEVGESYSVAEGTGVLLNAATEDADDCQVLAYQWEQTNTPLVALSNADTAAASFTAPQVDSDTDLTFEVTVSDGAGGTQTDTITITVLNVPAPPDAPIGDNNAGSLSQLALLVLGTLGLRRRRRTA